MYVHDDKFIIEGNCLGVATSKAGRGTEGKREREFMGQAFHRHF